MKYWLITLTCFLLVPHLRAQNFCLPTHTTTALVVIDMQPIFMSRHVAKNDAATDRLINEIIYQQSAVIKKAVGQNLHIIFMEYDCSRFSLDCGSTDARLKRIVDGYDRAIFIKKDLDGMFNPHNRYRDELTQYLAKNKIKNLILTGANGKSCVFESFVGALDNNCGVVVYSRAVADFNSAQIIYPFANYYSASRLTCENCFFDEVSSLPELAPYLMNDGAL